MLHLECPALQTYKNKLTELKFTVREFQFNAEAVDDARADREKLQQQLQQAQQQAKNTLQMAFGEVFLCHLHLKAIRLFVESVLWYGLPVNFQASVIKVNMRKEQGLKTALNEGFADAKPGAPLWPAASDVSEQSELPAAMVHQSEELGPGGDLRIHHI